MNNLFYKMKSKFMEWFSDIRIYPVGIVFYGNTAYEIKGSDMRFILNNIKPGDLLLRKYKYFIGSMIVPGYFSHIGVYVGSDRVVHMSFDGITSEDILTFMRCDSMCLLRPAVLDINKAINKANDYLMQEIPYDFNFGSTLDRMYCTEFINDIYDNPITSAKIIMPDEFLKCSYFNVIWKKT